MSTLLNSIMRRMMGADQEQISSWCDIHGVEELDLVAINFSTVFRWTPEQIEIVHAGIHDWILEQTDARVAMETICRLDHRVGIWICAALIRKSYPSVTDGSEETLKSVSQCLDEVERWVSGQGDAGMRKARSQTCWDLAKCCSHRPSKRMLESACLLAEAVSMSEKESTERNATASYVYNVVHEALVAIYEIQRVQVFEIRRGVNNPDYTIMINLELMQQAAIVTMEAIEMSAKGHEAEHRTSMARLAPYLPIRLL